MRLFPRSLAALLSVASVLFSNVDAFDGLPVWNPLPPKFPPEWRLNASLFFMPCNYSGVFNEGSFVSGGGVADFDWSNQRALWTAAKPMNCSECLVSQAAANKASFPASKAWIYKNLVKALPWMAEVRAKLQDPAFAGFFLKFDSNVTPHVPSQGSPFYHDQEQTPTGDCGTGTPCGEYLFDHRNGSMLRDFLVNEYVMGTYGWASGVVEGFFFDDL
jgi:hypothetical protein